MSKLKTLIFYLVFCVSSMLCAQTNIDSLNSLLPTSKGTERVDLLNTIAWQLKYSDPSQALELCMQSSELAKRIEYLPGQAKVLYYTAALLQLKGEYDESAKVSEQALTLYRQLNNSLGVAWIWNLRAIGFEQNSKYQEALESYEKALDIAQSLEDENFALAVEGNIANIFLNKGEYSKAIEKFKTVASEFRERADSNGYYLALGNIGTCYYRLGNYTEALPIYLRKKDFDKSTNQKYGLADSYNDIGLLYSKLELYEESIEMLEKSLRLYEEMGNQRRIASMFLHIGNHYGKINELEKSDSFFIKTLEIYDSLGIDHSGAIYNNLAENKIQRKEYDEAISLLNKALEINKPKEILNYIALNYTNLGTANLELGNIKDAEQYLLKGMEIWKDIGSNFEKQITASSLANIYEKSGNQKDFEYYSTIAKVADDSLFSKQKLLSVNKMLVQNIMKEYDNESNSLSTELSLTKSKLTKTENNVRSFFQKFTLPLLAILLLLLAIIFWLFKRHKQTSQLNRNLKIKVSEDREKYDNSIESKNKQLTLLSLESIQQDDLFKKINNSLQQIIEKNPENLDVKKLEKILITHSLDQNNWENFTTYFNEVYIGFFDRLSKSFPSITNKELRLCALIRLRIPSYEASVILGISPRSVHTSRYRIRKKMELTPEVDIDEFICSI